MTTWPSTSTSARRASCAWIWNPPSKYQRNTRPEGEVPCGTLAQSARSRGAGSLDAMAIEFSAAVSRIPVYPAAAAYALPEDVALLASNESPEPPLEPVVAAITAILTGVNRYPDPTNAKLRAALSDRY